MNNKAEVDGWVDGNSVPGDIYAVGEHIGDVAQALRGFQSVELWWMYLDCAEARVAVGEDNDALQTNDQDSVADGFQTEASSVCDVTLNTAGNAVETVSVKAYSDVKATADGVGQAILGLDSPGSPNAGDIARAEAWWDMLDATEWVDALYGDGAQDGDPTRDETATNPLTRPEKAQAMYDGLDTVTKTLVNDRWLWIYNDGGDEVDEWWDTIDCAAMRVVVGEDNEPIANAPTGFCQMWDAAATPGSGGLNAAQEETVFPLGRAILGLPAQPSAQRWWDALTDAQRVNVVYGNPLGMVLSDHDDDPDTNDIMVPVASDDDRMAVQNDYGDWEGFLSTQLGFRPGRPIC